jgi:hypothetical protein
MHGLCIMSTLPALQLEYRQRYGDFATNGLPDVNAMVKVGLRVGLVNSNVKHERRAKAVITCDSHAGVQPKIGLRAERCCCLQ